MRKHYRAVVLILLCVACGLAASAQSSPPSQMQTNSLSPEAEQKLAQKITRAIVMLPYYGVFDSIGYNLHERTVTLTGQVMTSSLKPDAERAVKKVEGVDKVVNNIEVLPPGGLDMRLRKQVQAAIYGYGPFLKYANLPNAPIRIIVKNSRVKIDGVVDTETDKNVCTLRVNQVPDVLSVTNNLRVAKP